jgi:uncharacterized protein YlaN (UPF0358 family)
MPNLRCITLNHESSKQQQQQQQHDPIIKMAYDNIESHTSYAWTETTTTTTDAYTTTNDGGYESSHYTTTDNDTNEEGFESSSSIYSDISSLSPIDDAASINSARYYNNTSKGYWCTTFPRFFNTFPCITKEEFDDEYTTMCDDSTCSSLILNDCSISEDYYDDDDKIEEDKSYDETDYHRTDRVVEVLRLKEDISDGNNSLSYHHVAGKSYNDTDKDAITVAADTITVATTTASPPHVCDTYKAHQNEVHATNTSHNGVIILLDNQNVEDQPNAVAAFLDRMLGLTEDEDEVGVDTETTTPKPTPELITNKLNGSDNIADGKRSGTKSTTNATDTITVASTASPHVFCESKPSHNDVNDLDDNENVVVRPNAVESFLARMLGLTETDDHLVVDKDKLYKITKIDLDNEHLKVQPNATEVLPFLDQMFSWMSTETDIVVVHNNKLDGIDGKSVVKTATKVVTKASMPRASKQEKSKKQSRVPPSFVNVMMRPKASKSSNKSSSENVTLVRSSSIAVEAIAKAPRKVDAKSKNNTKTKMKSSTRTKNKTPPSRSASKKEGIWTEYVDPTIGRPYYSNGIITTWKRPTNCPEIRIKHIVKNGQTITKH